MNRIELFPSEIEAAQIDRLYEQHGLHGLTVIAIAPGSKWFTKRWPAEYFTQLMALLEPHQSIRILVIGSQEDTALNLTLSQNAIDLRGKTRLLEVAEILKRCDGLISNDSSPIHIASAFNCHIIAIFGATTRDLGFFPWSPNSTVIEVEGLACRPCGLHGGKRCPEGHFKCMREIRPERVYQTLLKKLNIPPLNEE